MNGTYNLSCQFFTSDICEAIHVTGDTSNSEGGLYLPTDKRAPDAPNNPVWKLRGEDRFIFNTGSSSGWRIGAKSFLTNGHHWCKGKHGLQFELNQTKALSIFHQ